MRWRRALIEPDFLMPKTPNSIRVDHDGTMEMNSKKGTLLFIGKVNVKGDNGVELKASRVSVNTQKETALLTGQVSVRQKATTHHDGTIKPGIQMFADRVSLDGKKKVITLTGKS